MVKNKYFKKAISGITALSLLLPNFANLAVSAEEPEKFQYTMFGRNGITMSVSSNLYMNGNLHTNKDATITAINKNINGKVTTSADIEKRVKHVYADQKIYDTYFTTNCEVHEEEYVYSDMNIHINNPLFCYSNITLDGNVSLNSSLGTLMNINVTGEVKNANNSVVYSKYGNITIENDSTANVNGLIYAPLGTVTINSPNVTINGIIIADQVVINGSSVNINCNDNIARFIGETSEEYIFSGLEYLPEEWLGDTDEDALFDIYEKVIDSDPFNPDTDTDGLPDGYEVLTLGTDPLEIDTDENGILDCDEDFDTDNLNNLGEYQYQTLPFTSDTDEDGLLDGDEVNYYGTIPTDADTDDDKLLDGEEGYNGCIYIEHGVYFDPLNPDTDGNGILDGDEVFGQTKVEEVETYDEAITEVTVDMDTNGNIDRNLTIESMYNIDAMSTNVHALIGEPFNFETESDFESATITFKIDQSKLGDTQFDNLMILWYNEEEQIFEEMPTTHDIVNSTVSTTTTHFSQYMVVDSEKWYDNWEISFDQLRKMWTGNTSYYKPMNTILLLDCSHQMGNIDPINYRQIVIGYNGVNEDNFYDITNDMDNPGDAEYNYKKYGKRKCYRAEISENIINQMSNDDRAVVMTFSNDVETRTGWSSNWDMLMNGGVSRTSGIQKVNNDGSASFLDNAIQSALSYVEDNAKEAYRIIVITHSDVRCTYNLSSYDYSNVNLNIVNLGSGNISAFLESIVESTGGEVYDAITAEDLTNETGGIVTVPEQYIGEDSDEDGIPDLVELYGLKPNGDPINTNPNLKDTDGDGIEDNDELGYIIGAIGSNATIADYVKALQPHSDPAKFDSDDDGLDDGLDDAPLDSNNHHFLIYETKNTDEYLESCEGGNVGPNDYRYADMTKDELRELKFINWTDFIGFKNEFEEYIKLISKSFALDDMDNVIVDMFEYFFSGKGGKYSNSVLTQHARSHESSQYYIDETTAIINEYIESNNGDIKGLKYYGNNRDSSYLVSNMKNKVNPQTYYEIFGGLGICVDGTYGNQLEITSFKVENNNYEYTIRYTIYDIFGLDENDIEGEGRLIKFGILSMFRYWYILQHYDKYDGDYKPFITYIEFEETISGVLK